LEISRLGTAHDINPAAAGNHRTRGADGFLKFVLERRFIAKQSRTRVLANDITALWNGVQFTVGQTTLLTGLVES
jgi:hypothetical protein